MKNKSKLVAIILGILGVLCIVFFVILSMLKKPTYEVLFDTDGGSIIASRVVEEGEKVEKPMDPIKSGYEFISWNYNNVPYDFNVGVKENMTLKAVWKEVIIEPTKYTVTFNLDDETKSVEVADFKEIDVNLLGFEEKNGHIIKWYLNGEEFDEEMKLTSNITLEGKYVKVNNFTIKFNSNGGTSVKNQIVKTDGKVEEPKNVIYEGYILDGWYLNSEKYDFNTKVNRNFTLVAKWSEDPSVKRYTVSFDTDGGTTVESQRVIENKTVKEPVKPTKKNYIFASWNYNNKPYDFKTKVTSDIELKAIWREPKKYTVIFQLDDGKEYQKLELLEGETVKKPADPSKTGYTFVEWQLDGKPYVFTTKINSNITLKAKFSPKDVICSVVFDSNGGTSITKENVKCGTRLTNVSNPTRSGYTFAGWTLNNANFDISSMPINENIKLVAKWDPKSCKVTFDSNGGDAVTSESIRCNTKLETLPTLKRNNYTFNGWLLDNKPFTVDTVVKSDIKLVASWTLKTCTVTFNSNGGSPIDSRTINCGSKLETLPTPTRDGHTFKEWKLGNNKFTSGTTVTENITLTADWTKNESNSEPVADKYEIEIASTPTLSLTDVVLKVYKNNNQISFSSILDPSDFKICDGGNDCTVNKNDIDGKNYIVVLTDGSKVNATVRQ